MVFENGLSDSSFDELDNKLLELSSKDVLSDESSVFLGQKLEEKKADKVLKKYEATEIEELIELHKDFYELKKEYNKEKLFLTQNVQKKLNKIFSNTKASEVSKINLKALTLELKYERNKTKDTLMWGEMGSYRDFIKNAVSIKSHIPVSFIETNNMKLFYTQLTIKYLNFLERKYENDYSIIRTLKDTKKGFTIPKEDIINLIKEVLIENENKLKQFNSDLEIKVLGKIAPMKIKDIKIDLIIESKINEIKRKNELKEEELFERKIILNELIKVENELKEIGSNISNSTYLVGDENSQTLKEKFIKSLIKTGSLTKKEISLIVKNEIGFNQSLFNKLIENEGRLIELIPGKDNKQIESKEAKEILKGLIITINKLKKLEEKTNKHLKIKKGQPDFDIKFIKHMIENGEISVSELLKISEYETFDSSGIGKDKYRRFNYLEFIENYGLSEKTKEFLEQMLSEGMIGEVIPLKEGEIILSKLFIEKQKKEILGNLETFNKFIIGIECDGNNIDNTRGSGAEGYFQFHTGNGVKTIDEKDHGYNSFEVILRKAYKYYAGIGDDYEHILAKIMPGPGGKLKRASEIDEKFNLKNIPEWIIEAYNTPGYSPKFLTADQQNALFLVSAFENKTKSYDGKRAKEYIGLAMMGNIEGIENYYSVFHHTAVDEPTIERIKKFKNIYGNTLLIGENNSFQ